MRNFAVASALAVAFLLTATVVSAATQTFMLVPGIPGGSNNAGHAQWIDVLSVSQTWATSRKRTSCDVQIVKPLDIAGPKLWLAAVTGQIFPEVRIDAVTSGESPFTFYEIRLTNAIVSSIVTAAANGGSFNENLTLTATGATLTFYPQRPDGSLGTPVTASVPCN